MEDIFACSSSSVPVPVPFKSFNKCLSLRFVLTVVVEIHMFNLILLIIWLCKQATTDRTNRNKKLPYWWNNMSTQLAHHNLKITTLSSLYIFYIYILYMNIWQSWACVSFSASPRHQERVAMWRNYQPFWSPHSPHLYRMYCSETLEPERGQLCWVNLPSSHSDTTHACTVFTPLDGQSCC